MITKNHQLIRLIFLFSQIKKKKKNYTYSVVEIIHTINLSKIFILATI